MSASSFEDLRHHVGHKIECVTYAGEMNVAVECVTCGEVLMDFDNPEWEDIDDELEDDNDE